MGQQVAAIVYGVECTRKVRTALMDEDGEWRDGLPEDIQIETGENDDFRCLALTVAVQNVNEEGEAELPEGPLTGIERALRQPLNGAHKNWQKIAKWAATHKVTLPTPCLMLVTIERA